MHLFRRRYRTSIVYYYASARMFISRRLVSRPSLRTFHFASHRVITRMHTLLMSPPINDIS